MPVPYVSPRRARRCYGIRRTLLRRAANYKAANPPAVRNEATYRWVLSGLLREARAAQKLARCFQTGRSPF